MNRDEFVRRLTDRKIVGVAMAERDSFGHRAKADDLWIVGLLLDDGTAVTFSASNQVDVTEVWAEIDPNAPGAMD